MDLRSALEIDLRGEAFFPSRGNVVESLIPTSKDEKGLALVTGSFSADAKLENHDKNTILPGEEKN